MNRKSFYKLRSAKVLPKLIKSSDNELIKFLRMGPTDFKHLLSILNESLTKKHVIQNPISAEVRLMITLRRV